MHNEQTQNNNTIETIYKLCGCGPDLLAQVEVTNKQKKIAKHKDCVPSRM